jgi:Ca-activated chloride channel homolog
MCSRRFPGALPFCLALLMAGTFLSGALLQSPAVALAQEQPSKPPVRPPRQQQPPAQKQEEDQPQGQTAISVAVDLVTLQILVTDPKGNVILGLKPEGFKIYEDNVEQQITHFASVDANITVVMLVEYSRQVSRFIYEVWDAIYGFADSLKQGDWVAVIGYDMRPTILSDFTQDKQKLYDTLRRFNYPAFLESNLSDALIFALDRVEETEGKVAVLLVSTGLDTFSRATYDDALKKCKSSNASVYAISLGQNFRIRAEAAGMISPERNLDLLMSDNRLKYFAEYTGGAAYFPRFTTEFPSIFSNISTLLRNQYSISYASSNTKKDGKFRKIRVEVTADYNRDGKPDKVKVTTRSGYLAKDR